MTEHASTSRLPLSLPRRNNPAATLHASTKKASLTDDIGSSSHTKNVVVLGGSYGGLHAASVLSQRLPPSHRVILIERNSHFNHLYVFPRFSTLPGHEHKAFIPYESIFKDAPKRPSKTSKSLKKPKRSGAAEVFASTPSPQHMIGNDDTKEEMLGMGSVAGKEALNVGSSDSSYSSGSKFRSRHRQSSSDSRSSSGGEDSLFDKESLRSSNTTATSLSSSYVESSFSKHKLEEKQMARERDTLSPNSEATAMGDSQGDNLDRPETRVENLEDAMQEGIDLKGDGDGDVDASMDQVAQGYEDSSPHVVLQATVTSITPSHVVVQSNDSIAAEKTGEKKGKLWSIDSVSIPYSHMIYALGSHLPDPLRTEARSKREGMSWMRDIQSRLEKSKEIVLVGGGALGVEFALDIKSVHPNKKVTLIHSRKQLLPNFDAKVHEIALQRLQDLGVNVVLGERLALTEGCPMGSLVTDQSNTQPQPAICLPGDAKGEGSQAHKEGICIGDGRKKVKTTGGNEFECDLLLLCTGQQPNSSLMAQLAPTSVDSRTRLVKVLRTLQVQIPTGKDGLAPMPFDPTPPCGDCDCFLDKKAEGAEEEKLVEGAIQGCLSNVYAIGDVADAFGALNAGYQAWSMAEVAAENIVCDIEQQSKGLGKNANQGETPHAKFKHFTPAGNMLKLSLGLGKMVFQGLPVEGGDGRPVVEVKEDPADLAVEGVWQFMANMSTDDMYL